MKILFFTENIHRGGLDSFLIYLINHWPNKEDKIQIICNASHPGIGDIKSALIGQCEVIPHQMPIYSDLIAKTRKNPSLELLRKLFSPLIKYTFFLFNIIRVRSVLLCSNPDQLVVVNGGHPGGDTCRAAVLSWTLFAKNRPEAIYNFHNLAVPPRWFEKWPEKLIDSLVIGHAKAVIGVSQSCAMSLQKRIGKGNMDKVSWIYNGIPAPLNVLKSHTTTLREEFGLPKESFVCLMLATYELRKGHDFLLKAFKKVVSEISLARLMICGHGYPEQIERVRHLVNQYDLSDHVILQNFRQDIEFLLDQADLMLVASQSYESFGLTSVEAMSHRIPVVATRIGGLPEVVENGEGGYCVEPNDIDGYAGWIIKILQNSELRKSQGEKGYYRYKTMFTADRMAKQYARVIHEDDSGKNISIF